MKKLVLLTTMLAYLIAPTVAAADSRNLSINIISKERKSEYILTTEQLKKDLTILPWHQASPVYPKKMRYDTIRLKDLFAKLSIDHSEIKAIKFYCEDGFTAKWQGSPAMQELLIALNEHGNPDFFSPVSEGKLTLNPAPYYVITNKASDYKIWPWPSQVFKIDVYLTSLQPLYYPVGATQNSAVMAGYKAFSQYCIGCHSINLEGGEIGPELNIPKNITEYQNYAFLSAFIRDASGFRAKSRMMSFPFLSTNEIDQIILYLEYMKDYKRFDHLQ